MQPHLTRLRKSFAFFIHLLEVDLPPFVDDFNLEMEVTLNWEAFIFALACSPCLSFSGPLGMVYDDFVLDDFVSGFDLFLRYVGTLFEVISTFSTMFFFCILIPNIGEIV